MQHNLQMCRVSCEAAEKALQDIHGHPLLTLAAGPHSNDSFILDQNRQALAHAHTFAGRDVFCLAR